MKGAGFFIQPLFYEKKIDHCKVAKPLHYKASLFVFFDL
mgnify:FL=1